MLYILCTMLHAVCAIYYKSMLHAVHAICCIYYVLCTVHYTLRAMCYTLHAIIYTSGKPTKGKLVAMLDDCCVRSGQGNPIFIP